MSFKITWDTDKIIGDLRACTAQASSHYNDGFSAWGCKRDLLLVKYALDEMLEKCPNFSHEEEKFHDEMSKKKIWKTLNGRV